MSSDFAGAKNQNPSFLDEDVSSTSDKMDFSEKKKSKNVLRCLKCDLTFAAKRSLLSHCKKFHPEDVSNMVRKTNVICPVCDCDGKSIIDLQNHIQETHKDIELKFENLQFFTWEDFNAWKKNIELESLSCYLKRRSGSILADGRYKLHYYCHRSGCYRPQGDGKRRLKRKGSNKINKSCPAHISVYSETNEDLTLISVRYQSVHVGHFIDIEKFSLTKSVQVEKSRTEPCAENMFASKLRRINLKSCSSSTEMYKSTQSDFDNNPNRGENEACVDTSQFGDYENLIDRNAPGRGANDFTQLKFHIDDQKAMLLSKFLTLLNKINSEEELKTMYETVQSLESKLTSVNDTDAYL